jgi:hypothetical protein
MKPCAHLQCTRATAESSNSTSRSVKGNCEVETHARDGATVYNVHLPITVTLSI